MTFHAKQDSNILKRCLSFVSIREKVHKRKNVLTINVLTINLRRANRAMPQLTINHN